MAHRVRVRKATAAEQAAYRAEGKKLYPLYGFVTVDGPEMAIEDLRGSWSRPDPQFEVMAPAGFHFCGPLHSILCNTIADLKDRMGYETNLQPCDGCN